MPRRKLEDRVAWIPASPSNPADLEAWCRRKSVKRNARGFFLASWGEVLGSRKKLQEKDLQKQKRCGLLECSCEDVMIFLAGGKGEHSKELRRNQNTTRSIGAGQPGLDPLDPTGCRARAALLQFSGGNGVGEVGAIGRIAGSAPAADFGRDSTLSMKGFGGSRPGEPPN
jgi:hypothetical protein